MNKHPFCHLSRHLLCEYITMGLDSESLSHEEFIWKSAVVTAALLSISPLVSAV